MTEIEHVDINKKIESLKPEEITIIFSSFFTALKKEGPLAGLPDYAIFSLAGLIKDGKFINPDKKKPLDLKSLLKELVSSGRYNQDFIEKLHLSVVNKSNEKNNHLFRLKIIMRALKIASYGGPFALGLHAFIEDGSIPNELIAQFLVTMAVWDVIDRITVNPVEKQIISAIIMVEALKRVYLPSSDQRDIIYSSFISNFFPDAKNQELLAQKAEIYHSKIKYLLDTGFSAKNTHAAFSGRAKGGFTHGFAKDTRDSPHQRWMDKPQESAAEKVEELLDLMYMQQKLFINSPYSLPEGQIISERKKYQDIQIKRDIKARQSFLLEQIRDSI